MYHLAKVLLFSSDVLSRWCQVPPRADIRRVLPDKLPLPCHPAHAPNTAARSIFVYAVIFSFVGLGGIGYVCGVRVFGLAGVHLSTRT